MDYKEAIEILKKNKPTSDSRRCGKELCTACDVAISSLQELQMYKENKLSLIPESVYKKQCKELDEYKQLGTLTELKEMMQINFNAVEILKIYNCIEQLIEYQQLGTPEEIREAMERQDPKKVKYMTKEGKRDIRFNCPNCATTFVTDKENEVGYCTSCGQKMDWSE